jgi:hypothetical protein
VIETLLEKVIRAMAARGYEERHTQWVSQMVSQLMLKGVEGLPRWLGELRRTLGDQEQYLDICEQASLAWIFARSDFKVAMNPLGRRGPDLMVEWRRQLTYVEVGRLRRDYEESRRLQEGGPDGMLVPYGRGDRDVWKLVDLIVTKSRQGKHVPQEQPYLVAIWSDKDSEEGLDFDLAVLELEKQQSGEGAGCREASAVLFSCGWTHLRSGKYWYVWENPATSRRPLPAGMAERLTELER